ncbi:hypothetical protein DE146DRAFT_754305 [Phaeosphaeria sp. MPI-PUGE-AT-0046c]|nr:hypothetical protein DE146DRAFT_754305 [Phaeosphaeria sp. MPI-PUGE-AT-0046c]
MENLPAELNCMIASHFDSATDSASYRLTSKYFARIGAEEHFRYFPFGSGTPSSALSRMQSLTSSPLIKHVKGLDYIQQAPSDEEGAPQVHPTERSRILAQVARGFWAQGARIELLQTQGLSLRVFDGGLDLDGGPFAQACEHVADLMLSFDERGAWRGREGPPGAMGASEKKLRTFLGTLPNLTDLGVSFSKSDVERCPHALRDVVPLEHVWPRLKSLHLWWMDVEGAEIIALLQNHADMLRCIHLSGMTISAAAHGGESKGKQWRKVFDQIAKMKLDHGEVHEKWGFGSEEEKKEMKWVGTREDGRHVVIETDLKKYLVEGGEDEVEEEDEDEDDDE